MNAVARSTASEAIRSRLSPLAARVGNTPLIPLPRLGEGLSPSVKLFAKAEWLNPTGSVKDRPAVAILEQALASDQPGSRSLLDSSSGNMGIGYATYAPRVGNPLHLVVPENISPFRLKTLQALGVQLSFSDALEGSDGARAMAAEMAEREPDRYYYLDQYSNPANPRAHYRTTGPETLTQSGGHVTHLVAGLGTGGTLTGTGRYLREALPAIEIIAVQPDGPLHGLEGLKHYPSSPIPEIFDPELPDRTLSVSTEAAYEMVGWLAREEGLLVGISSGAAALAALQLAQELSEGYLIAIFPDSGSRYLDDPLWRTGR